MLKELEYVGVPNLTLEMGDPHICSSPNLYHCKNTCVASPIFCLFQLHHAVLLLFKKYYQIVKVH